MLRLKPIIIQLLTLQPILSSGQFRLHFSPPLVSATSDTSVLDFREPRIRVIQSKDVQEYSLGVDGLYKF